MHAMRAAGALDLAKVGGAAILPQEVMRIRGPGAETLDVTAEPCFINETVGHKLSNPVVQISDGPYDLARALAPKSWNCTAKRCIEFWTSSRLIQRSQSRLGVSE